MSKARGGRAAGRISSLSLRLPAATLAGCNPFAEHFRAPPDPLRPTSVGVVAKTTQDSTGYHDKLIDGHMVDIPQDGRFHIIGEICGAGYLLLAGTTDGGFATALEPSTPGCWDTWPAQYDHRVIWDMGSSIRLMSGLDLPKAAGFHADPPAHEVDGNLAWVYSAGDRSPGYLDVCANERGEIESALAY